jgi:hypothetical protein
MNTLKIHCPWHFEKTPSCFVSLEPGRHHADVFCFGCGKVATMPELVARLDQVGNHTAITAIARHTVVADNAYDPKSTRTSSLSTFNIVCACCSAVVAIYLYSKGSYSVATLNVSAVVLNILLAFWPARQN